ncbi:MAG: class IV adenylate cyclase [Luteitalea sp.]
MVEREIKLEFTSVEAARAAVGALGLQALRPRRLQDDALYDQPGGSLQQRGVTLRLRLDGDDGVLTWKGPLQPGPMKTRPEIESTIGDPDALRRILEALGYGVVFRYQKYRQEYGEPSCIVAIDETPVGVFVEIEGEASRISATAARLGCTAADYLTVSYAGLHQERGRSRGLGPHMLFPG